MAMDRRDFLKWASVSGLCAASVGAGLTTGRTAQAQSEGIHTLFMFLHLGGGCDWTSFVDPKGYNGTENDPDLMNNYPATAIRAAGNIRYAPMEIPTQDPNVGTVFDTFFNTHYTEMTVINGLDHATNSHEAGSRALWSGSLAMGGPAIAAEIAAVYAPDKPMGFITNGGYDDTAGLVGKVRAGNLNAMNAAAYPNRLNPNEEESRTFHTDATMQRINQYRNERLGDQMEKMRLVKLDTAMQELMDSRNGSNELALLAEYLPEDIEGGLVGQAQFAIAAFRAGICTSVNLSHGGYDTHGNNDQQVANRLVDLMPQITAIFQYAEQQGVRDRVCLFVGSDFGRTPGYNDGQGKDHWSIASMLAMGSVNGTPIPGNRVIGETTFRHEPTGLDPATLAPGGSVIPGPGHMKRAIRKLAGIEDSDVLTNFPVDGSDLDIDLMFG